MCIRDSPPTGRGADAAGRILEGGIAFAAGDARTSGGEGAAGCGHSDMGMRAKSGGAQRQANK
eukprot:13194623-Alexandrium_andersonii.AAC.1